MEDIRSNRVKKAVSLKLYRLWSGIYLMGGTLMVWRGNVVVIITCMIDNSDRNI